MTYRAQKWCCTHWRYRVRPNVQPFRLLLSTHLLLLALEGFVLSLIKRDRDLWQDVYWPALSAPVLEDTMLSALRRDVQATRIITAKQWFATTRWQLR